MPETEKTDYSPVVERAPEAGAERERRVWRTFFWGFHAFWIYAVLVAAIILLVVYLTGGFGEGGAER